MKDSKIKQDGIQIGSNIREIRKAKGMGQTDLVSKLQLMGIDMTRESLVKIERGIQHVYATQLQGIKIALNTSYDELLK
jgi:transcriptional regulator with XRE-family HTH domain